eukprot:TRINITY_DN44114_c0_g1_i1.p1 TRINITY_DN44114_c0_g1~~TRINITY_DN44114_c0_g1_i1.p1  ORF type:complete len:657 (-),score=47.53 TRINITY_DN44114_c0_g1_i1:25-1941(-)
MPRSLLMYLVCPRIAKAVLVHLLLTIVVQHGSCRDVAPEIGYQIHSMNDLREWKQLVAKGADMLKIDMHWIPLESCQKQVRLPQWNDHRGCFVLSHDDPTAEGSRVDFNTSLDFLALLAAHKQWRLTIALCFKAMPPYACPGASPDSDGGRWISLVDDLVANRPEHVEFILDGGVPTDCQVQRWRPLVSTAGPAPAFTANSSDVGYDRWQVLNPPAKPTDETNSWKWVAERGWGKFKESRYAFQVWEPSDEVNISDMARVYIATGYVHNHGVRFAINIDPAQFQLYARHVTGRGWHDVLEATSVQEALVATYGGHLLTIFRREDNKWFYRSDAVGAGSAGRPGPLLIHSKHATDLESVISASSFVVEGTLAAVGFDRGGVWLFDLVGHPGAVILQPRGWLPLRAAQLSSVGMRGGEMVQAYIDVLDGHLRTQRWSLNGIPLGDAVSISGYVGNVKALDVAIGESPIVVFTTDDDALWCSVAGSTARVGVGSKPRISVAGGVVALVYGDGYCPNSEVHNKQTQGPALCDAAPTTTKGVLNYALAHLPDFEASVVAGRPLSACDAAGVLHGAYSQGTLPAVTLWSMHEGGVGLGLVHLGTDGDAGACGAPAPRSGIVAASFTFPILEKSPHERGPPLMFV